jgi:hypothetical protein
MPFLIMWVNLTGVPMVITITPNEPIKFEQPAKQVEAAGCPWVVCKT